MDEHVVDEDQPLFELGETHSFSPGDRVIAQTIWGDEPGKVVEVEEGLATVALGRGDRITISLARLVARHGPDEEGVRHGWSEEDH